MAGNPMNVTDLHGTWELERFWFTDDAGTGFVHTAPSHGQEDYEAFVARGWMCEKSVALE